MGRKKKVMSPELEDQVMELYQSNVSMNEIIAQLPVEYRTVKKDCCFAMVRKLQRYKDQYAILPND